MKTAQARGVRRWRGWFRWAPGALVVLASTAAAQSLLDPATHPEIRLQEYDEGETPPSAQTHEAPPPAPPAQPEAPPAKEEPAAPPPGETERPSALPATPSAGAPAPGDASPPGASPPPSTIRPGTNSASRPPQSPPSAPATSPPLSPPPSAPKVDLGPPVTTIQIPRESEEEAATASTEDVHVAALGLEDRFPPASTCARCHPDQYAEWSVSAHAYAQMSPVFNAMHATIVKRTNGTNGDFCIRCHTPVGMLLEEPVFLSNLDRDPASREGITCIACHRVNSSYGKISGRVAIEQGPIFDPVYGPQGGAELKRVLSEYDAQLKSSPEDKGSNEIHAEAREAFFLTTSGFCGTCHDVNLVNGFRLEEAFSEYKHSPAASEGISCQDCHMASVPGVPSEYRQGPAAVVAGIPTTPRKRTNHMFAGPDYSLIHPGLFPHNVDAQQLFDGTKEAESDPSFWMRAWLRFDYEAGWGQYGVGFLTEFEDTVSSSYPFPPEWSDSFRREDARKILDQNFALLDSIASQRKQVLRAGYEIGRTITQKSDRDGLAFRVEVRNATKGHGVPTGFDAERLVFLRVTVRDSSDAVIFQSGDFDPNGDLRDAHSSYVHDGLLSEDRSLFSLQSKFLTQNLRGGEREQVLAINYSVDPLPFLRPQTRSHILTGRPGGARKHKEGIPPGASRWAEYEVDGKKLTGKEPYRATIELVAGMIPINLVHEVMEVGFDYDMSPQEIADGVLAGHQVLWTRELVFRTKGGRS